MVMHAAIQHQSSPFLTITATSYPSVRTWKLRSTRPRNGLLLRNCSLCCPVVTRCRATVMYLLEHHFLGRTQIAAVAVAAIGEVGQITALSTPQPLAAMPIPARLAVMLLRFLLHNQAHYLQVAFLLPAAPSPLLKHRFLHFRQKVPVVGISNRAISTHNKTSCPTVCV